MRFSPAPIFTIILILFLPFIHACTPAKVNMLSDPAGTDGEILVEYRKGPCFGTCPVSVTTVYENRMVGFDGQRYTHRTGYFFRALNGREWKAVRRLVERADWWGYPERFDSDIADLPTYTLTVYLDGRSRTITGKEGFPDVLQQLMAELDLIGKEGQWDGGILE
jgi:hypothetical protein